MSQLDDLLLKLPRSTTALIVLIAGIAFVIATNPPHSVCDTEREVVLESLKGPLFATSDKKGNLPALLSRTKAACRNGVSSGACFEYFSVLRKISRSMKLASSECHAEIYETPEIRTALEQGIELMALLAWGEKAPESQAARVGWFTDAELMTYCKLKDNYIQALGEEEWAVLRKKVYRKFPLVSVAVPPVDTEKPKTIDAPKAFATMGEIELYSKSLFSVQCSYYKSLTD